MINDSKIMDLLVTGMKAEGLRQKAIANNVANMNTKGFRRSDVNFEEALIKAIGKESREFDPNRIEMEFFQPKNLPLNEMGNDVTLDREVGEMVKNSIKHKTYMLLLKKKYQQMNEALKL